MGFHHFCKVSRCILRKYSLKVLHTLDNTEDYVATLRQPPCLPNWECTGHVNLGLNNLALLATSCILRASSP